MRYRHQIALSAIPLLVVAGYAYSQGYQPNFIRNLVGPITITGNATASGDITADHYHSTAAGTENGFNAPQDVHYTFNDPTNTVYMSYDGTNLSVAGAPLSLGSSNIITTGKYCTTANCSTNYISNDTFGTTTFTGAASFSNNVSIIGFISAGDYAKLDATAVSGGNACSAGNEGKIRRDSAGGGTTGHRTKICLCTSDGAGTPAYAWQNIISGTVGTTTACND